MIKFIRLILCLSLLPASMTGAALASEPLQDVDDFSVLSRLAGQSQRPILLMFAATHCEYCQRLEQEQLNPMLISDEFDDKVIMRRHVIDRIGYLNDFSGRSVSYSEFADRYDIDLTPTIVFLDPRGRLLGRKLYGYNGSDFFSVRLEQAINVANKQFSASP